jgi:hypothetical protein
MTTTAVPEWRDPVQLYCLRARRRWLILLGAVVAALLAAAYWYVYLA